MCRWFHVQNSALPDKGKHAIHVAIHADFFFFLYTQIHQECLSSSVNADTSDRHENEKTWLEQMNTK